jgi:hypothetical protein
MAFHFLDCQNFFCPLITLPPIPHSGYIPPEAIFAPLSVLSSLESETRRRPPPKRSILPTLENFRFKGVSECLEDLVTFIDAPQLYDMNILFLNQIDFDFQRLTQFINCSLKLRAPDKTYVQFDDSTARVLFQYWTSEYTPGDLRVDISCKEPDWQLSSIEQVCNSSFHLLATIEDLHIEHLYSQLVWKDDAIENTLWLELLLTAVINLYLSKEFAPGIAAALQELVEGRITEVLPSPQNTFVEVGEPSGPFQENIGQFVEALESSGSFQESIRPSADSGRSAHLVSRSHCHVTSRTPFSPLHPLLSFPSPFFPFFDFQTTTIKPSRSTAVRPH